MIAIRPKSSRPLKAAEGATDPDRLRPEMSAPAASTGRAGQVSKDVRAFVSNDCSQEQSMHAVCEGVQFRVECNTAGVPSLAAITC